MSRSIRLYLITFCIGAMNTVSLQMLPFIFEEKKFDTSQVGILLGLVFLSSIFIPIIGMINKKFLGDLGTYKLLFSSVIVGTVLMYFTGGFALMAILVLVFSLARLTVLPVNDSFLTKQSVRNGVNFGLMKSGASLGFGLGMIIFTIISAILDSSYSSSLFFIASLAFIALVIVFTLPDDDKIDKLNQTNENSNKEVVDEKPTIMPKYILLMLVFIFYYGGLCVRVSYLPIYYDQFGYTTTIIAITTFFMVIPELTIMPFYNKFFGKYDKTKLIGIAIMIGIIQMLMYITCHDNLPLLIIASLLNGCQIMIFFPSFYHLLGTSLSKSAATLGFLINMTLNSLVVAIILIVVITPLYVMTNSTIPVFFVIIASMAIAFLPLVIYFFKYPNKKA